MNYLKHLIIFTLITSTANAQSINRDYNSGKHWKGDLVGKPVKWECKNCEDSLSFVAKPGIHKFQNKQLNVTLDNLLLTIHKIVYKDRDVAKLFEKPIELLVLAGDSKTYQGNYQDPITKNTIVVTLRRINAHSLTLEVKLPEMNPTNDIAKGTIFKTSYNMVQ